MDLVKTLSHAIWFTSLVAILGGVGYKLDDVTRAQYTSQERVEYDRNANKVLGYGIPICALSFTVLRKRDRERHPERYN
jgi:hypothetical protein